ncbi:MAG TPA: LemA family protein, partial [Rhodocyclaceae bacterium]
MGVGSILFIGALVVILIYGVMLYNGLVQVKHAVARAWANIDVLLKQRHDELPKLVETCKQYKQFEQDTLQRVIEARSRVQAARETQNVQALGQAEAALRA